jgi:hypothetical protein
MGYQASEAWKRTEYESRCVNTQTFAPNTLKIKTHAIAPFIFS